MSMKSTLALMVVLLGMLGFVLYDQTVGKPSREAKHEDQNHMLPLREKKLIHVTVKNGADKFELQCLNKDGCQLDGSGDWELESPIKDMADNSVVGSLAATLKGLSRTDKIDFDQGLDPNEFGFPETALSVDLILAGEKQPITLTLGKASPVGGKIYATSSVEPKSVSLVESTLPSLLKQGTFHWRNKRLLVGFTSEGVVSLDWKTRGVKTSAVKGKDGWNLLLPVAAPANDVMLEGLASTAAFVEAKSIYSRRGDPEAKKALAGKPALELSIGREKGEPATMRLFAQPGAASNSPDFVAEVAGSENLYVVDGVPFERFQKPILEYRNRKLFPFADILSAERMEIKFPRDGGKTFVFQRKDGVWNQVGGEPPAEPLSQVRLVSFFAGMDEAQARDFVAASDPKAAAFGKGPADTEVKIGEKDTVEAKFWLSERQFALTSGANPKEVKRFGADFLKVLPIRAQDLYESSNKKVILQEPAHGNHDAHDHQH